VVFPFSRFCEKLMVHCRGSRSSISSQSQVEEHAQ
jgi:hypothetical protein